MNSEMYEGSSCFSLDFSSMEAPADRLHYDHQQHLNNLEMDQQNQLIHESHHHQHQLNWTSPHDQQHYQQAATPTDHTEIGNNNNCLPNMPVLASTASPSEIFNLFHLPRCSNASISFTNPGLVNQALGQVMYDQLLPLNLPQQLPFFGELLHDLPNGDVDMEREVLRGGKDTKHFPSSEKHRRRQLNDKFEALKHLVPNPTKPDRASIVRDAIDYINELKRTMDELKILVERKRCNRGRTSTRATWGDGDPAQDQQAFNDTLRSSWLQRKSKHTEVDVRIIDDEVTIKLVQQKKINCLLLVSKILDELQLELHYVAGGLIGDFYSYLFNTKISEGCSVYASAIANKLIEVVDREYAAVPATPGY